MFRWVLILVYSNHSTFSKNSGVVVGSWSPQKIQINHSCSYVRYVLILKLGGILALSPFAGIRVHFPWSSNCTPWNGQARHHSLLISPRLKATHLWQQVSMLHTASPSLFLQKTIFSPILKTPSGLFLSSLDCRTTYRWFLIIAELLMIKHSVN